MYICIYTYTSIICIFICWLIFQPLHVHCFQVLAQKLGIFCCTYEKAVAMKTQIHTQMFISYINKCTLISAP